LRYPVLESDIAAAGVIASGKANIPRSVALDIGRIGRACVAEVAKVQRIVPAPTSQRSAISVCRSRDNGSFLAET
jgi:hypothetical protein